MSQQSDSWIISSDNFLSLLWVCMCVCLCVIEMLSRYASSLLGSTSCFCVSTLLPLWSHSSIDDLMLACSPTPFLPSLLLPSSLPFLFLPSFPLSLFLPSFFLPSFLHSSFFPCLLYPSFLQSLFLPSIFLFPKSGHFNWLSLTSLPLPPPPSSFPTPRFSLYYTFSDPWIWADAVSITVGPCSVTANFQ